MDVLNEVYQHEGIPQEHRDLGLNILVHSICSLSSSVMKTLYPFLVTCCKMYFLMDTAGKYYKFIYIDKEIEASLFYSSIIGTWQITNGKNLKKRGNVCLVYLGGIKSSSNKYVR